jgi:putative aldouronate transport system permease protein
MAGLTREGRFDFFNYLVLSLFAVVIMYPLYFVLIASFSDPNMVASGHVTFAPQGFTLAGYRAVLEYGPLWTGYANSLLYTITGTAVSATLTLTGGYVLSRKDLVGRNIIMLLLAFTMVFSGGLIPTYLIVKNLGMINTLWAMIIPSAVSYYYLVMCRTFFQTTIPDELLDSARMDGCGNARFFVRVVLPISPAIIAIMVLYYAVGNWNAFFNAFIYLNDQSKYPIQLVLRMLIIQNQSQANDMTNDVQSIQDRARLAELVKYGAIIFASAPVLVLYPFMQRYFVKGVMIGAIKG